MAGAEVGGADAVLAGADVVAAAALVAAGAEEVGDDEPQPVTQAPDTARAVIQMTALRPFTR